MNKFFVINLLLWFSTLNLIAQNTDDIIGKYQLPNKLNVQIYKVGDKYNGKIIALNGFENGQKNDIHNDDENKHSTPLIGMEIIKGLRFDFVEKQWIDGEIYSPEKGIIINLKITKVNSKEIEVVGSKYFFWKTLMWKRLKN